jgi:hypothetical protein
MTPARSGAPRSVAAGSRTPNSLVDAADALFRASIEACRQHERFARFSARGCSDDELKEMAELCAMGLRHLAARTEAWANAAADGQGKSDDAFWHAANAIWHSSREYARRHYSCDALATKSTGHSTDALGALTLEYELEASALLALLHAVAEYRRLRSDVE